LKRVRPTEYWPDAFIGPIPVDCFQLDVGLAFEPLGHDGVVPLIEAHNDLVPVGHWNLLVEATADGLLE
jgi:hypothetical protein